MIQQLWALGQPATRQGGSGSLFLTLLPWILIFAIFYFLLIRPQQKRQKQHRDMVENLRRGDRVVTSGGIYGTVSGIKPDLVILRIADNVKIEVQKSAIGSVIGREKGAKSTG